MGIKNLTKIIQEVAPAAIKEITLKELMGRRVAIDASMAIYQFLVRWAVPRSSLTALLQLSHHRSRWQVAVRSAGEGMAPSAMLMNEAGEVTSHLQGMFSRTIRLMESGVKPLYVFDGKAPTLKSGELAKRKEAKDRALADLKVAEEKAKDDTLTAEAADEVRDEMDKLSKRTVHMDKTHQEDCKRLLRLMGVPVVEAPCEAEAQCAILAKAGLVYGAATEDMDTLCFGTPKLIRRLTMSEARKMPVWEFDLARILADTELSMDQFVDMCILCGCDYLEPIKGIGPKTALTLIRKHGTLADTITALRADDKYTVPEEYPIEDARRLFTEPDVADPSSMSFTWSTPDEAGILAFLVEEKGFNADRVKSALERLKKARGLAAQTRMDTFFKTTPAAAAAAASSSSSSAKGGARAAKRPTSPAAASAAKRGK